MECDAEWVALNVDIYVERRLRLARDGESELVLSQDRVFVTELETAVRIPIQANTRPMPTSHSGPATSLPVSRLHQA